MGKRRKQRGEEGKACKDEGCVIGDGVYLSWDVKRVQTRVKRGNKGRREANRGEDVVM